MSALALRPHHARPTRDASRFSFAEWLRVANRVRDVMDVGRLDELMERLARGDRGVTVRPVREGAPSGDWGTQRLYEFDGWEVGWITAGSVEAIAAGLTVAEAVEAALNALDSDD